MIGKPFYLLPIHHYRLFKGKNSTQLTSRVVMFSDIKHLHAAHVVLLKCQENTAGQFNSTRQCSGTWQPSMRWNLFCLWNSRTVLLYGHFNRQWGRCGETKTSNSQINDTQRGVLFFFIYFFRLVNKNIPKIVAFWTGKWRVIMKQLKVAGITWQPTQQFLILLQIKIQAWWECSAADRAYKCHTDKATSRQMTHCSFFTHLSDMCANICFDIVKPRQNDFHPG